MCERSWWSPDRAAYRFPIGQLLEAHGVDIRASGLGCINIFVVFE